MAYPGVTIGEHIRVARRRREWTQTDLGSRLDMEQPTISDLERDVRSPTGEEALVLAQVLGVTVGWLLGEPERPPQLSIRERVAQWAEDIPYEIPVIDQEVHAGFGAGACILERAYWPAPMVRGRNIIGLRIRGDCLRPDIEPGDTVFLDRDQTAVPGKIVVASVGDQVHICRVGSRSGRLWLVNNETDMPVEEAQVEGVVIQLNRDL